MIWWRLNRRGYDSTYSHLTDSEIILHLQQLCRRLLGDIIRPIGSLLNCLMACSQWRRLRLRRQCGRDFKTTEQETSHSVL